MRCEEIRERLLGFATIRPESWSRSVRAHMQGCPACRSFADRLNEIEDNWRQLPVPPECEVSKAAFLRKLPSIERPRRRWLPVRAPRRWAAAAAIFLIVGLSAYLIFPGTSVHASSDILQQLVDLNVRLAETDEPARARLLAEQRPALEQALQKAELPPEDRELAQTLLENMDKMAASDDPVDEADRFDQLADKIADRLDQAVAKGNTTAAPKLAQQYAKITGKALHANLEKAKKKGASKELTQKLERITARDLSRSEHLTVVVDRAPVHTQQEIRKALGMHGKGKGHKKGR